MKDANGVAITSATNVANINPFRYRSYYYDTDTQLYYLQSRYYDPETGRFINGDEASLLADVDTIEGYNLFAYCENKSVYNIDPDGYRVDFFYGRDQERDAKSMINLLEDDGFLVSGALITSAKRLAQKWNRYKHMDIVVINMHGKYAQSVENVDFSLLNKIPISALFLLSCNAGHLDYPNNPAMTFFKKFRINWLICCDGTHYRRRFFGKVKLSVEADKSFKELAKKAGKPNRKSQGFILYERGKAGYRSLGKSFGSILALFHKVGFWA